MWLSAQQNPHSLCGIGQQLSDSFISIMHQKGGNRDALDPTSSADPPLLNLTHEG